MSFIKDAINKMVEKKRAYKELEFQDNAITKLQQRKLTSEERELMRYKEAERQESIKHELAEYRKKQDGSLWKGASIRQNEDISKHQNAFSHDKVFKQMQKVQL